MYQTILIPTDGSSDAIKGAKQGIGLAAALDATVHGLFVVTNSGNPWESTSMEEQDERAEAYGKELVDEIEELAEEAGVEFVSSVRFGSKVYEAINDYVDEEDIDLIAMGSGYHGEFGGLLGSTADKILRTASVPVLTLRRQTRKASESSREPAAASQ